MNSWDTATWLAVLAVAVSGLSLLAAMWAAWVSHRTLKHAETIHADDQRITFEREQSQLLEDVNTSRRLLDRTRIKIGTLKVRFDAAPQPVKVMLSNYTNLFTDYFPRVEEGVRQCNALWDEIAAWDQGTGIHALVRHQSKFRALVNDDEFAHDQGLFLVGVFEEKMNRAMANVADATR
jgi:hypothetical protein